LDVLFLKPSIASSFWNENMTAFHGIPGADLLDLSRQMGRTQSTSPQPGQQLRSSGGGGVSRAKQEAKEKAEQKAWDDEKEAILDATPPKGQDDSEQPVTVRLKNPRFVVEVAEFHDKVKAKVDVELPPGQASASISMTLFTESGSGQKEWIQSLDAKASRGVAEVEFTLFPPQANKPAPGKSAPYFFTAQHAQTQEVISPKISVKEGEKTLVLEFADAQKLQPKSHAFVLCSMDGKFKQSLRFDAGAPQGKATVFEFQGVDFQKSYRLSIESESGACIQTLFTDKPIARWKPKPKESPET
jgi:hypothetical protein